MIWSPSPSMIFIDLLLISIVVIVLVSFKRYGMLSKGYTPRTSKALIGMGIAISGCFYTIDLLVMVALPRYVDAATVTNAMTFLHLDIRWYMSVLSLFLICMGVIASVRQRQFVETTLRRNSNNVDRVQKEISRSESRFRSLIEQTTDAVYCLEFQPPVSIHLPMAQQIEAIRNGTVVECNQVFATETGVESMTAVLGKRFREVGAPKNTPEHYRYFSEFITSGYRLKSQEFDFRDAESRHRAYKFNVKGVIQDDALVRIWGTEIDVREQRRVNADLIDRRIFEAFIADISSHLISVVSAKDAGVVLVECMERVCRFLNSDRASILWFDREQVTADIAYYWNKQGQRPDDIFSLETFPWMGARLFNGKSVRINKLSELPPAAKPDAKALNGLGLKSAITVPLAVSKDALGVLAIVNSSEERVWTDQDLLDVRVIADLFANVVVRVNAREALDSALEELRLAKERLEAENVYLRQEISSTHGFDEICGESPQLTKCLHDVQQVAGTTTTVLIQGETGTGKELIARALHERSDRADRPLVKVNCAALPANLIESELFGHEKGAFTGAHSRKRGLFDLAHGGTLFLDEIGDFPLALQAKLLRVIQEGEFQRLGGTDTIDVDVRLIAATNRVLQTAVDSGEFRADLFYRINTFPIHLPTLAERDGDIPILAEHITRKQANLLGKDITAIAAQFMGQLVDYDWPGNVRELESVIQRALISCDGSVLDSPEPIAAVMRPTPVDITSPRSPVVDLSAAERLHIEVALYQARWVIGGAEGAAESLGIPASTLRSKMKKLGILRPTQTG